MRLRNFAVAALLALAPVAQAADFTKLSDKVVMLQGPIVEGDCGRLLLYLVYNTKTAAVGINTPGGTIGEAICMGNVIRGAAVDTIAANAYSAGAIVWASGHRRLVLIGGAVAQHGAVDPDTREPVDDETAGWLGMALFDYYTNLGYTPEEASDMSADSLGSPEVWISWVKYATN